MESFREAEALIRASSKNSIYCIPEILFCKTIYFCNFDLLLGKCIFNNILSN